jgi:hypothetical protein
MSFFVSHGDFVLRTLEESPPSSGTARLYTYSAFEALKSLDGGVTWTSIRTPTESDAPGGSTAFDVMNVRGNTDGNDIVVLLESQRFNDTVAAHISTDGGATWTKSTDIFSALTDPPEIAYSVAEGCAIISDTEIIATVGVRYVRTFDNGLTWGDVTSAWFDSGTDPLKRGFALTTVVTSSKVWSLGPGDTTGTGRWNHDGSGQEHFDTLDHFPNPASDTIAVCYDTVNVYGDNGQLTKVVGTTVTVISPTLTSAAFGGAATTDGSLIIANSWDADFALGRLWRSTDGGSSWTEIMSDASLLMGGQYSSSVQVSATDPTFWMVVGYPKFWYSNDSGLTWTATADYSAGVGGVFWAGMETS